MTYALAEREDWRQ